MENRIPLSQVGANLWEVTKKYGQYGLRVSGLLLLGYLGVACGAKPQVITIIKNCDGEAEVDAAPGVLQKIEVPGINIKFIVNPDGSITYFSNPPFTDIPPVENRPIGILNKKHLELTLQGDIDGGGNQDITFRSVCPTPPKPTPPPQPSGTPIGSLKGSGRIASTPRGFDTRSSKPTFSNRIRF